MKQARAQRTPFLSSTTTHVVEPAFPLQATFALRAYPLSITHALSLLASLSAAILFIAR